MVIFVLFPGPFCMYKRHLQTPITVEFHPYNQGSGPQAPFPELFENKALNSEKFLTVIMMTVLVHLIQRNECLLFCHVP